MKFFAKQVLCAVFTLLSISLVRGQAVVKAWVTNTTPWVKSVMDNNGNIFTLNTGTNPKTISKITQSGIVTSTFATLPTQSSRDFETGMCIDAGGNIFVTNEYNFSVSKITPAGVVTGAWAQLANGSYPMKVIIDASGNLYTENYNRTITKISSSGTVTQTWADFSIYSYIGDIAVDANGNVFTYCYNSGSTMFFKKISQAGVINSSWTNLSTYENPYLTSDASGNLYCINANTITKISPSGVVASTVSVNPSSTIATTGVFDLSGDIYVANNDNSISQITAAGVVTNNWATTGYSSGNTQPNSIIMGSNERLYVVNSNKTISKILPVTNLQVSTGPLTPAYNSTANNYTALTTSSTITVTPTITNSNITSVIKRNNVVQNGAIALAQGSNNFITVTIMSNDGLPQLIDTINVTVNTNLVSGTNTPANNTGLANNSTGSFNVAIGDSSLYNNTTGNYNVALGYNTLNANNTNNNNTALGSYAGFSVKGNGNTLIGNYAGYNETGSNKLYIGNSATQTLIYGDFSKNQILLGAANANGNTGYAFASGAQTLHVKNGILADSLRLDYASSWADDVFNTDYKIMPLHELKQFIQTYKHLPDIPSEADVKASGLNVFEMNSKLLRKIEELTLHTIEQQKQIDELKCLVEKLMKKE